MSTQLESSIQSSVIEYAKSRGWLVEKVMKTSRNGFPDLYLLRRGVHILIEMKRPLEEPTTQQLRRHREIRNHGGTVYVFDNLDDAKKVLY